MLSNLLAFTVVVMMLTMLPGIDTAQVLRSATLGGPKLAYATLLGIMAGVWVWGIAAAIGISALLLASPTLYDIVRYIGGAYLLWLGLRIIWAARSQHAPAENGTGTARTYVAAFSRASVITITNPKNGLFYIAMLPQFLPKELPPALGGFVLSTIHNGTCLLWFSMLIWGTNRARAFFERPRVQQWMERISGIALLGFGAAVFFE